MEQQPRWMRLDNAAKIYPAARRRSWNSLFRLSAYLNENVDNGVLKQALNNTIKRFPSVAVKIRRGAFWYYLEEIDETPPIREESAYPMARMSFKEIQKCAFRVITYNNRISIEFFHAVTDATGGTVFLKSLVAEYIELKYKVSVPNTFGVLDRLESPKEEELEDSFLKNYGPVSASRKETTAYRLGGDLEADGYLNLTTGIIDCEQILKIAHSYKVSVTELLTAVMIYSITAIQNRTTVKKRQKPVKVLVPVNLRKIFGSKTLRNFALYVFPGIDPKLGEFSLEEIIKLVHHQMGSEIYGKNMASKIAANVSAEKNLLLKIMPLFIKNIAMKAVFNLFGDRKASITLSNIGVIEIPEEMKEYVNRFDFILGQQALCTNGCSALSYMGKTYITFLRTVKESEVEKEFFCNLINLGIKVKVESNRR